jgi:hypothetical protein
MVPAEPVLSLDVAAGSAPPAWRKIRGPRIFRFSGPPRRSELWGRPRGLRPFGKNSTSGRRQGVHGFLRNTNRRTIALAGRISRRSSALTWTANFLPSTRLGGDLSVQIATGRRAEHRAARFESMCAGPATPKVLPDSPNTVHGTREVFPGSNCTVHRSLEILPGSICTVHRTRETLPESKTRCIGTREGLTDSICTVHRHREILPGSLARCTRAR